MAYPAQRTRKPQWDRCRLKAPGGIPESALLDSARPSKVATCSQQGIDIQTHGRPHAARVDIPIERPG